ncbi:MAG: hypothetical protein QXX41_08475 [Nitrososphaerota archaeon]
MGKSTISNEHIHIPRQVIRNYALKNGDQLEFYPHDTVFPDREAPNLIAVLIVRATTGLNPNELRGV